MPTGEHAAPPEVIRIVIADDHSVVREGLRTLVESHPGLAVVGEAATGHEAYRLACELLPKVLLLDISMPGGGLETAERIARECPAVRVVALTMHEERGYVLRLLRAGAAGYVPKRAASAEVIRAIRMVAAGGTYVDASLAGDLLATPARRPGATGDPKAELTTREAEVLRLVARGYTNREIGEALEIGVKTVETHKANGMTKLGIRSRAALVHYAITEHWLTGSA